MLERGINQLISQALDTKAKGFQTRIEGVVQNYIYTQNNPQNQDKQNRKHKTVDEKEDSKSNSSSDFKHAGICDISDLIPIPGLTSTVAKTTETADKKSGAQECSKSATSKSFPTGKKYQSMQGKSNLHAGKGEESKNASPFDEKVTQVDESSKSKDGKSKTSRVKAENMSRDESRLTPKVEESFYKVKDEMSKINRLKLASSSPGESCASSSLDERGDKYMTSEGKNENANQSYLSSGVAETEAVKEEIMRGTIVKADKGNEANTLINSKVKEETVNVCEMNEESNVPGKLMGEQRAKAGTKVISNFGKLKQDNMVLNEGSKCMQSDSFQTVTADDEVPKIWSVFNETPAMDVTVSAGEFKEDENVKRFEPIMLFSEKISKAIGADSEERNPVDSFKNIINTVKMPQSLLSDGGIEKVAKEFPSEARSDASKMDTSSHEVQRLNLSEESLELLSRQKEGYDILGDSNLEASSLVGVDFTQPSSMGEFSDSASDISDVSSVHTSDLSSFDDEDDEEEEAEGTKKTIERRELEGDGDTERTSVSQSEQNSGAAPRRRSTRISSRRSTKEGESETSEGEASKEKHRSSHKRRHGEKRTRKPGPVGNKVRSVSDVDKPRRRGRPRKDDRHVSSQSGSQIRHSRAREREDSGATTDRSESDTKESRSTRSQRQIKRTRCYSPSSEGTREVFLPRKRSRDDVN